MEPRYNPADLPQAETQVGTQAGTQEGIQAETQGGIQAGTQEASREEETPLMGSERWASSPLFLKENDRTLSVS